MTEIVQLVLAIIGLNSISRVTRQAVNKVSKQIERSLEKIKLESRNLLDGKQSFHLSSGDFFDQNLGTFISFINGVNKNLDFNAILSEILEDIDSKILKFRINKGIELLKNKITIELFKELETHLAEYVRNEILEIEESLKGESFFNLTKENIPINLSKKLDLGKKYCPYFKISKKKELYMFDQEITQLFTNYLTIEYGLRSNLSARNLNKDLRKLRKTMKFKNNSMLVNIIGNFERVYNKTRKQFKNNLIQRYFGSKLDSKQFVKIFNLEENKIIIEADKNVGYVCMYTTDLLDQYAKINVQQHFGRVDLIESWYIDNIRSFITDAKINLPTELSKIIVKQDFIWDKQSSEIGVLRLQPKVLKLKAVNFENIGSLTSRGIKSSMKDPIKVIQKILDKIFNHLLFHIEENFYLQFGRISPTVTGVKEAISRIKASKTGQWGKSIEIEGDFTDLYSNCNEQLLLECVEKACKYAKLHDSSFSYIKLLIKCIMSHSYFKEPTGIFKTLKGFSMGDCSAARGSEIILRIYEIEIFKRLSRKNLLNNVYRFLRFRDDVSLHISGTNEEISKIIKIIGNGYPSCIIFNMESRIIYGKFLNIRIYNNPKAKVPLTTVLRKSQNKYNIIPPNSNTHKRYKRMAGLSYFKTARTHTSTSNELQNQFSVIYSILRGKGFTTKQIKYMENFKSKRNIVKKRFLSKTVFDEISKRHEYVSRAFRSCNIDQEKYFSPMELPGRKLEQMIFTVRKMRKKLGF